MPYKKLLRVNKSIKGEDLMNILRNRKENKDVKTNTGSRPLLYGERQHGVLAEGNPKADKWDLMQDSKDMINKVAKEAAYKAKEEDGTPKVKVNKAVAGDTVGNGGDKN